MKRILLMLLCVVLMLPLFGCAEDPNTKPIYVITSTTVEYTNGDSLKSEYTFDKNDHPIKLDNTYNFNGTTSVISSEFTCNSYGQILTQFDGSSKTENIYNSKGQLETTNLYYGETLDAVYRYFYESDRLVKKEVYAYGMVFSTVTYTYNEEGRTVRTETKNYEGNLVEYVEYTYSRNGKTATCKAYNGDGSLSYSQKINYKIVRVPLDSPRDS